jgi:hypothetical protein
MEPAVPIHYHCTGNFAVIPVRWRREFLLRNLDVRDALKVLCAVYLVGRRVFERFGPSSRGQESRDAWLSHITGVPGLIAFCAEHVLAIKYYLEPGPQDFDRDYGPTRCMCLIPGPADPELYPNLWDGFSEYGFPNLSMARQADVKAVEAVAAKLERTHRPATTWAELTKQGRREVRATLVRLRKEHGLPAPRRRPDAYYNRLLALWDAREGFGRDGYDKKRRKSLRRALACTGGTKQEYYRAFEMVTGQRYSAELHCILFESVDRKRNAGRPRGAAGTRPPQAAPVPLGAVPAVDHADPAEAVADEDAMQFFREEAQRLLEGESLTVQTVVALATRAGLYPIASHLLRDPDSLQNLEQFLQGGNPDA